MSRVVIRNRYGFVKPVLECACAVVWGADGRVLAVSRHDAPDKFSLPGGKVDPEDRVGQPDRASYCRAAAQRELLEETGLHVRVQDLDYAFEDYDQGDHYTVAFVARRTSGEIATPEPHVVRWLTLDELYESPFGVYYRKLFKEIRP